MLKKISLAALIIASSACSNATHKVVDQADSLVSAKQYTKAILLYERALEENPNEPVFYLNQAALFRKTEKTQRALRNFNIVKKLCPDRIEGFWGEAQTLESSGSKTDARDAYLDISEDFYVLTEKSSDALFEAARITYELGDGPGALGLFERLLQTNPAANTEAYFYRGKILGDLLKNKERAKDDFTIYVARGGQKAKEVDLILKGDDFGF